MRPQILIVGAGATGAQLAERLCQNWEVIVVDLNAEALASPLLEGCVCQQGDATSALVLRRFLARRPQLAVASTGSDEVNLEVLQILQREHGLENGFAVMRDPGWQERYQQIGAQVVNLRGACAALLESRIESRKVARGVGLGEGEIVEVTVLPNSSVVGYRLRDLRPSRWLVGAVYRDGQLVVPHGDTVIAAADRLLLIGDPRILSSIATHVGRGEAEFPLHYGSSLVGLLDGNPQPVLEEVLYLLKDSAARRAVFVTTGEAAAIQPQIEVWQATVEEPREVEVAEVKAADLPAATTRTDTGLLALAREKISWPMLLGLRRSRSARLLDRCSFPVLVCSGRFPYRQVLLTVAELPFPHEAATLAIDLARTLRAELHLVLLHQPELVAGAERRREMEEERRALEHLAGLYHVTFTVENLEGNPVEQLTRRSQEVDLLVMPYQRRRRASLIKPDVAQHVLHRAHCSVLLLPH